jgi:ATP-dependent DNA helicase RecQ
MTTADDLLKKYWGYSNFLPCQEEIIGSILAGHDTLAIKATGGGKSLCYQLPALCLGGLTLVISPLISLMKDQVDDLNARGIAAAAYTSALDYRERSRIENGMKSGDLMLLFVSPEKCMQPAFLELLKDAPVRLIAIDEAHCISEWGHNFRPEYRQLSQIRKYFPGVPVIALTATAIPEVRRDISQQLGLVNVREFIGSFNRANLHYHIVAKKNPLIQLLDYVSRHRNESGIIYCLSKKETEEIAAELKKRGFRALAYHAGLSRPVREKVQDAFIHDTADIVCATVAFGMGIDKPDVRYVIHYVLPKTIESYYQETGRAGRDGNESECILFFSRGDSARVRSMLEHDGATEGNLRIALRKLQDMTAYCETTQCRRKFLLNYFGEPYDAENCGSCDNCDHPVDRSDGTEQARMILACVEQLSSPFGSELIADVLRGAKTAKITSYHLDLLPAYGTGQHSSKAQYRAWINDMVRLGFLARTGGKYPVIIPGEKSGLLRDGKTRVMLPVLKSGAATPGKPASLAGNDPEDAALFQVLKSLRRSIADREGVLAYRIFPDKTLHEMARVRPVDRESFLGIAGVGTYKLEKYGHEFMDAIRNNAEDYGSSSGASGPG